MIPRSGPDQRREGVPPAADRSFQPQAAKRDAWPALQTVLLAALVAAIYLLHQDFWNWKKAEPLVLGFLPIGLAYQAGYSILAAAMMAVLVKTVWPKHLEEAEPEAKTLRGNGS